MVEKAFVQFQAEAGRVGQGDKSFIHGVGGAVKSGRGELVPFDEGEVFNGGGEVAGDEVAQMASVVVWGGAHVPGVEFGGGLQPFCQAVAEDVVLNDVDDAAPGVVQEARRGGAFAVGDEDGQALALDPGVQVLVELIVLVEGFLEPEEVAAGGLG